MGYATIISGGEDGRYLVELDFGEAQRIALLATIAQALVLVGEKITAQQQSIDFANAIIDEQREVVRLEAERLAVEGNNLPPGSPVPDTALYKAEVEKLRKMISAAEPRNIMMRALKQSRTNLLAKQTQYTFLNVEEQRNAWCCDYTEDAEAGTIVATVDIPGESDLILIAPGCRSWAQADGTFKARELMSPEQCYYNAAVLPTWQKYKPTYRWGTCTYVNVAENLMNVQLAAAISTAANGVISVNQSPQLNGVTVQYMDCNADAFEVDDRVVVKFLNQDWTQPVVIGFLDNPRPCATWPTVTMDIVLTTTLGDDLGVRPWANAVIEYGTPSCGFYSRVGEVTSGGPYNRPIAKSGSHVIELEQPVFSDPVVDEEFFTLSTEGGLFATPLWTHANTAMYFDVASGPTGDVPAPGATECNSMIVELSGDILLRQDSTEAYSQSQLTVAYSVPWPACTPIFPHTTGAWMHPGTSIEIGLVPVTSTYLVNQPADEFLTSSGAMPTIIVDKDGATAPVTYALTHTVAIQDGLVTRWRLTFNKPT